MSIEDITEAAIAERFALLSGWQTDFRRRSVSLSEIEAILPRDRIQPVDRPEFASVSKPPDYMRANEPVIAVRAGSDARAYPLAMLMWHEIVNDTLGGKPITVTFCPLCNSALVFETVVNGRVLTFGTTGALRNSDLVMWDRQTESWWQQITGEAIVGTLTGTRLAVLPASIISWEAFSRANPSGKVMKRMFRVDGSPFRDYDDPPYAGYDDVNETPFAFQRPGDERLPAMARVVALESAGTQVAYPFEFLKAHGAVNDRVGSEDIVVFFEEGVRSPFWDAGNNPQLSGGAVVFRRRLADQVLTFEKKDGALRDRQTGSVWTVTGAAVSGPMAGAQLEPVAHGNHFWFAWAVFKPETQLRKSLGDLRAG
jgi:hypothetical protein